MALNSLSPPPEARREIAESNHEIEKLLASRVAAIAALPDALREKIGFKPVP